LLKLDLLHYKARQSEEAEIAQLGIMLNTNFTTPLWGNFFWPVKAARNPVTRDSKAPTGSTRFFTRAMTAEFDSKEKVASAACDLWHRHRQKMRDAEIRHLIRVARIDQIIRARIGGVTLSGEAKREAPVRTEPHPTRASPCLRQG
jgi:hypothetical protein